MTAPTEVTEGPDEYDEEHLRALRPDSQPLPTMWVAGLIGLAVAFIDRLVIIVVEVGD